jgi:Flp pilus assembly protein TadG
MAFRRRLSCRRSGAAMLEGGLVLSGFFLLTAGVMVLAMGVYRYQQVASLAREACRYASVHGGQYAQDTGQPMATPQSIYNNVIKPNAVGMDLSKLGYNIQWDNANEMPFYLKTPATNQYLRNRVKVSITYQWIPEFYLSPMFWGMDSEMEMSY